jgi:hypothetical protein
VYIDRQEMLSHGHVLVAFSDAPVVLQECEIFGVSNALEVGVAFNKYVYEHTQTRRRRAFRQQQIIPSMWSTKTARVAGNRGLSSSTWAPPQCSCESVWSEAEASRKWDEVKRGAPESIRDWWTRPSKTAGKR